MLIVSNIAALQVPRQDLVEHRKVLDVLSVLHELVDSASLVDIRDKWYSGTTLRCRLNAPEGILDHACLEILSCDGVVIHRSRLGRRKGRPTPMWMDPTFAIPWSCVTSGGVGLEFRIAEMPLQGGIPIPISEPQQVVLPLPQMEDSINCVLEPVRSKDVDQAWRDLCYVEMINGINNVIVAIDIPWEQMPDDLAIGIQLVVMADKHFVDTVHFYCDDSVRNSPGRFDVLLNLPQAEWAVVQNANTLTAIVIADPEYALRDLQRHRYWDGGAIVKVGVRSE